MKLYSVFVWCYFDNESGATEIVVAESTEMAQEKALENGYYDMAEATEVKIEGYKIILECNNGDMTSSLVESIENNIRIKEYIDKTMN